MRSQWEERFLPSVIPENLSPLKVQLLVGTNLLNIVHAFHNRMSLKASSRYSISRKTTPTSDHPTWHRSCLRCTSQRQTQSKSAPTPIDESQERASHNQPSDISLGMLLQEVSDGSFWSNVPRPSPPWALNEVVSVSLYGIPLGLILIILGQVVSLIDLSQLQIQPIAIKAVSHLGQEIVLSVAIIGLLSLTLGKTEPQSKGFFSYSLTRDWFVTCLGLSAICFPLVDPILYTPYSSLLHLLSEGGGLADGAYKEIIDECKMSGETGYIALLAHFSASCLVGPFWEETFWRGFILPSIVSRLPRSQAQVGVVLSSTIFSSLHLSLSAGPSIFLVSSLCDLAALRSSSIGPSLMIHCLFNSYQFLGVVFLGKDFV